MKPWGGLVMHRPRDRRDPVFTRIGEDCLKLYLQLELAIALQSRCVRLLPVW